MYVCKAIPLKIVGPKSSNKGNGKWGRYGKLVLGGGFKCPDSSLEVTLSDILAIMTDRPTYRPTDGQTGS